MVDRTLPLDEDWGAVDRYIEGHLVGDHPADALAANAAAGLPEIDVSPAQGKLLHLLARMAGARRVLEIGTLGGYSTTWLARAVGPGGQVVSLELEPRYAEIARLNLDREGLSDRVDVRIGAAVDSLSAMSADDPFDFVFIDADKPSNFAYLREAIRLSRSGATIIVDNVVREGGVLQADSDDPRIQGTRELFAAVAAERRLSATAVQTVGVKKWDGFLLAMLD